MAIIDWETQRLTRSINTLREFSRPRQLRFGMHDLQEVVKKAILVINQDFELVWARKIIIRFPDSFPQVKMDPDAIEQVAINLIKNALQATHEGGAVTVKLKTVKRKTGEAACLEVSDNGKGIPQDLAEHIFEPHFSTKMGMGLGMHIVKQIVDTHEGTIHLKSTEGKGTVIKVHLPLFEEHQGQSSGH